MGSGCSRVCFSAYWVKALETVNPTGTLLGAALALAPSLLCCTPALPLAITAIASLLPAAGHFGVPIQGWIATHEGTLYALAIAAMAW